MSIYDYYFGEITQGFRGICYGVREKYAEVLTFRNISTQVGDRLFLSLSSCFDLNRFLSQLGHNCGGSLGGIQEIGRAHV